MEFQNISLIKGYHVHVYFEQETFEEANRLCQEAGKLFPVKVGRMHSQPVGPHPCGSCQLAFAASEYTNLLSWLALNRGGLSILIHPLTGNDLKDHTDYAAWMGDQKPLNLDVLRPQNP